MPARLTPPVRIVLLTAVFILLVATGIGVVSWQLQDPARPDETATATRLGQKRLFYGQIGTTPAPPLVRNVRENRKQFTIELASTRSREQAEKLLTGFGSSGIEAWFTPLNHEGRVIYRIRTGMFTSREAAEKAMAALQTDGNAPKVTPL